MEQRQPALTGPLEHDDSRRQAGIKKLATYVMFENVMVDHEAGKYTRDTAFELARTLHGHITEAAV